MSKLHSNPDHLIFKLIGVIVQITGKQCYSDMDVQTQQMKWQYVLPLVLLQIFVNEGIIVVSHSSCACGNYSYLLLLYKV